MNSSELPPAPSSPRSLSPVPRFRRSFPVVIAILLVTFCGLLPWARNRIYLRDFYDYGIVMSGVGRIDAGEHLYRDIVTPIQSGIFLLSAAMEKMGDGTFQSVTRGAAWLIFFTSGAGILVLQRRWPVAAAAIIAAGIVFASAAQHTIIWYNAVGVLCLALVAWGSALAPVWRRTTWPWHALPVAGLWFGGINKINFQIIALAVACAWTLRAGINGRDRWRRVMLTLVAWIGAGVALPFFTELIWTGASPAIWWHNVIELPSSGRSGELAQILTWKFHVASPKTFYGTLLLPQIGLASVALLLVTGFAVQRLNPRAGIWDRFLIPLAVVFAIAASDALHATNNEIGYVSLGAAIVLASSLWLGFELVPRGPFFWGGLVMPSLLIGVVSWQSAWIGQRSQFGHSLAPRGEYLAGETIAPSFAYLRGTYIPPDMHLSFQNTADWLSKIDTRNHYPVFYGPGAEWLERIFPAIKPGPTPLVAQWGTTYGPRELKQLITGLQPGGVYPIVLSINAWDYWDESLRPIIEPGFQKHFFGEDMIIRERRVQPLALQDTFGFADRLGGGILPAALDDSIAPMDYYQDSAQRWFLGVSSGSGKLAVTGKIHHLKAEAKLCRLPGGGAEPIRALFRAIDLETASPCWSAWIDLEAGQNEAHRNLDFESAGAHLELQVDIPREFGGLVAAGYRDIFMLQVGNQAGPAPELRPPGPADESIASSPPWTGISWRPEEIVLRGGHLTAAGAELNPGGELWLRTHGTLTEFWGSASTSPDAKGAVLPVLRVVWTKGSRFEIMHQQEIPPAQSKIAFTARSPEPDGWIGILIDRHPGALAARISLDKITPSP